MLKFTTIDSYLKKTNKFTKLSSSVPQMWAHPFQVGSNLQ